MNVAPKGQKAMAGKKFCRVGHESVRQIRVPQSHLEKPKDSKLPDKKQRLILTVREAPKAGTIAL